MRNLISIIIILFLSSCAEKNTYFIEVLSADGLSTSSSLYTKGIEIGKVKNLVLSNRRSILIEVEMEDDELLVPVDSEVSILNDGLFGDKAITIELGKSNKYYNQGDTIKGLTLLDDFEPISGDPIEFDLLKFSNNVKKLDSILIELRRLNKNLEERN